MTNTNFRGPVNSMGAMEDATSGPEDGPSLTYQGTMFPSLRDTTFAKDGVGVGRSAGFLTTRRLWLWIISRRLRRRRFIAVANSSAVNFDRQRCCSRAEHDGGWQYGGWHAICCYWCADYPVWIGYSGYGCARSGLRLYDRNDHGGQFFGRRGEYRAIHDRSVARYWRRWQCGQDGGFDHSGCGHHECHDHHDCAVCSRDVDECSDRERQSVQQSILRLRRSLVRRLRRLMLPRLIGLLACSVRGTRCRRLAGTSRLRR